MDNPRDDDVKNNARKDADASPGARPGEDLTSGSSDQTSADRKAEPEGRKTEGEPLQKGEQGPSREEELAELNDRYLRLHAEFDNYKKRMAKDREDLRKFANEGIIMDLLSVIDHLEMAVSHAQGDALENVVKGVEITLKEFERVFESHGVKQIRAKGLEFDPNVHHAMTQVPTKEAEENTVVEEFRKGYMLHDKVIRPSLVAVATHAGDSASAQAADNDEEICHGNEPAVDG